MSLSLDRCPRRFTRKQLVQHELVSDTQQREWIFQHRDLNRSEAEREIARTKLVTYNLRIVDMLVQQLRYDHEDADDVFQDGVLGLLHAIRTFNPSYETKFVTYASYRIKASIRAERIRTGRRIHVPSDIQDFWRLIHNEIHRREVRQESLDPEAIHAALVQRGGYMVSGRFKKPTDALKMIQFVLDGGTCDAELFHRPAHGSPSEDPETSYQDTYGFHPVHHFEIQHEIETHHTALLSISPWCSTLPEHYRVIFYLRYGLNRDGTPYTYPEIRKHPLYQHLDNEEARGLLRASWGQMRKKKLPKQCTDAWLQHTIAVLTALFDLRGETISPLLPGA